MKSKKEKTLYDFQNLRVIQIFREGELVECQLWEGREKFITHLYPSDIKTYSINGSLTKTLWLVPVDPAVKAFLTIMDLLPEDEEGGNDE